MGAPCFPQPNLWLARCASMSWTALKKFVVLSTQELRIGKKPSFHCGWKTWQVLSVLRLRHLLCLFRLAPSCRPSCEMVRDGADDEMSTATQPRYATAMFYSNQPEIFPLSAGISRPYLPSAPNKATETVIFCFGEMFARAAAAAGGSSSCRRKQQQQEAGRGNSTSSRRKQQQQEEATTAGENNSNRRQQQQQ